VTTQAKNDVWHDRRRYVLLHIVDRDWSELAQAAALDSPPALPRDPQLNAWFDVRAELAEQGFRMGFSSACWAGHTYELRVAADLRLDRLRLHSLWWGDDDAAQKGIDTALAELEEREVGLSPEDRLALERAFIAGGGLRPKPERRPAPRLFGKLPASAVVENGSAVTYEDLDTLIAFTGTLVLATEHDPEREALRLRFRDGRLET
jgi:hypothetical protein